MLIYVCKVPLVSGVLGALYKLTNNNNNNNNNPEICLPLPEQEASLTHTVLIPPILDAADGVNVRALQ